MRLLLTIAILFSISVYSQPLGTVDLTITQSPRYFCEINRYPLKIINNRYATVPVGFAIIGYSVNGGISQYDTVKTQMIAGRTYYHLLPRIAQFNRQNVKIWISNSADTIASNDTILVSYHNYIVDLPYHETFENWQNANDNCWGGTGGASWKFGDSSHIVNRVVPSFDKTTGTGQGKFLYANTWNFQTNEFRLPRINLANQSSASLAFWYQSPAFYGNIYIRIYRNSFNHNFDEDTLKGPFQYSQANPWNLYNLDLSAFVGDTIGIEIYAKEIASPPNVTFDDFALTTQPVGLEKRESESNSISIYPNPSNGIFNLNLENDDLIGKSLRIFNSNGQLVIEQKVNQLNFQLNIQSKPKGLYYLKISNHKLVRVQKLIIH